MTMVDLLHPRPTSRSITQVPGIEVAIQLGAWVVAYVNVHGRPHCPDSSFYVLKRVQTVGSVDN
jgi:hypothetical protein